MKRRYFLGMMGLGAVGIGYGLRAGNVTVSNQQKKKGSVIFITLGGGASHTEFFHPAPDAPAEYTSVTGNIQTKTPGLRFGGLLPELAQRSDKFTVVKSFSHKDFNHNSATHVVQTGYYNTRTPDTPQWPSYGSVVAKHNKPVNNGMPTYIKLSKTVHNGSAWLGQDYEGFDVSKDGLADMIMQVSNERFERRKKMLESMESDVHIADNWLRLRDQAIGVLHGDVSKVFNIEQDKSYEKYKATQFGKDLLTARRLVQNGAGFVLVSNPGWDHHQNIETSLKRMQPDIDHFLSLLIDEIYDYGLSDDVMVVFTTEFGRTPKINPQSGRDHWAKIVNLLIAGGKYKGGYVGEVDRLSQEPTTDIIKPSDLTKTVLDFCGIDNDYSVIDTLQRPRLLIESDAKII